MRNLNHYFWLVVITMVACILRVVRLDFQPLWWDEGYSVFFATRDFGTMIARTAIDIHPPLYYALMQIWMAFAGKTDVTLRLLSVLIGIVTIPVTYMLARKLFNPRIGLIASTLLALSPFHIYYSQEVRMYGLVTLLGLVSIYLCIQLLRMKPGTRQSMMLALFYIVVTAAALYTQYYAAFILAAEILLVLVNFLLIDRRPLNLRSFTSIWANPLAHWLGAWLAIIVLYIPWVVYAGPKLYTYVTSKVGIEKYAPLDPITFLAQHLAAFATGHLTQFTWLAWVSVVMVALVALAMIVHARKFSLYSFVGTSPSFLIVLYLFIPLIGGYLVNLVFPFHPIHGERLLLIVAPAFYLVAALGIAMLWSHRVWLGIGAMLIVALTCGASLYDFYTTPRYPNDDYRPLIADMQTIAQPNDILLAIYPWQIGFLQSYYTSAPLNIVEAPSDAWINHPSQMQSDLDATLKKNSRVWIPALQTQGRIIEDALDANLRPRAYSVVDDWYGATRLEMFTLADDAPRANRSLAFGNELTIADWGIADEPIVAGQDVLRIWINAGNSEPGTLKASLRLVDAKGNVWAQDDREITGDTQRIGLFISIGTPPGEYDARLAIYRANDGKPIGNATSLARVQIITPTQPNLAAIPHRTQIDLGNGINWVGFSAPPTLRPGEPSPITFFWQATRAIDSDYQIVTQIQDARGNVFATTQAAPARGFYPTTRWQSDEIVRDPQTITLRGDTPDGDYRIVVTLIDSVSNIRTKSIDASTIAVKGRLHYFGAPSPSNKFDVRFGDVARLVGYDVVAGQRTAHVVLYWQALASSEASYKVFVHLVDANGTLRAQGDQVPGAGAYPTTSWTKGEYLVDVYDIDAPPGEYTIRIGMYNPATNTRLPVFDASGQSVGDYSELSTRITVAQ